MSGDVVLDVTAVDRLKRIGGEQLVRRMIELYLEQGPARLAALTEAVRDGDAAGAERVAHALKSSAGNVGAERLQQAAQTLETLSAAGELDASLADRVRAEYAATEEALRAVLQRLG
jgi:HPt (histidine-containing phosphotransfer) domain-containing protein